MMGLFDGASPTSDEGSTAELAGWLEAPVVLLCDASAMARSLAALASGYARFDPTLRVIGVVANRIGGRGHLDLLRAACTDPPVLGGLPERKDLAFPERHLGLRAADRATVSDERLAAWATLAAEWLDVDRLVALARAAPPLSELQPGITAPPAEPMASGAAERCRLGVAHDEAFHFYYDDNLARLEALGARLVRFSPVHDARLPPVDGLYLGGGYPEALAGELAGNVSMRRDVREMAARGAPIYAECGGLMYLCAGIRTLDGVLHPMVGLIPREAIMAERLRAIGYVEVETRVPSLFGPTGVRFRGHEFRYSDLAPQDAQAASEPVYTITPRWGGAPRAEGIGGKNVLASYVHAHFASAPAAARRFVDACADWRSRR
jgi:cobyrinic acid a,c-diamide synthase